MILADRQKNLSKELIILWIASALIDISEEMIKSSCFECTQIMIFFTLALRNHFLCFCFLFFFQSAVQNGSA